MSRRALDAAPGDLDDVPGQVRQRQRVSGDGHPGGRRVSVRWSKGPGRRHLTWGSADAAHGV